MWWWWWWWFYIILAGFCILDNVYYVYSVVSNFSMFAASVANKDLCRPNCDVGYLLGGNMTRLYRAFRPMPCYFADVVRPISVFTSTVRCECDSSYFITRSSCFLAICYADAILFSLHLLISVIIQTDILSPVSTTRVDGPSWRVTGFHYPSTRARARVSTSRVDGPYWRVTVNSASGNRALVCSASIICLVRLIFNVRQPIHFSTSTEEKTVIETVTKQSLLTPTVVASI